MIQIKLEVGHNGVILCGLCVRSAADDWSKDLGSDHTIVVCSRPLRTFHHISCAGR
jgi:hypothetical protein